MNPIVYAIPVFLLSIVLEAWLAKRRSAAVYDIPDAITSLHLGVLSQISGLFLRALSLGIYVLVWDTLRVMTLPADSVWVWIAALIAYDFFYYWHHRLGHEVNVLWAAHVVHHSSEYYNLSTALRQSSSTPLLGWLFYLPLALAGVPPQVFIAVALIDLLYQYWVHTELIGRLGWFDRVFCSPSNHRVHHGQNDYCIDRNYGGILILWDRLFGTFAEERDGEPIRYGIRSPLRSLNPIWGNLHHYVALWRQAKITRGWRAQLALWLGPPGGWKQPLPHFEPADFQRYDPATPTPLRHYAACHYALAVVFVTDLLARHPSLSLAQQAAYASGIALGALALAAVLEGRRLALRFEQIRLVLLALALAATPDWFGCVLPTALKSAAFLFLLGSAAWLERVAAPPSSSR